MRRPFTLEEARAVGLTPRALEGRSWRRIGSGIYCWRRLHPDTSQVLEVWQRRLPMAVFSGQTAAWIHGIQVAAPQPIVVIVPPHSGIRSRPELVTHRCELDHFVTVRGLRVTTIQRTLADACRGLSEVEALVLLDAAVRLRLIQRSGHAEPAESPMETRLPWLLLEAGLPRPLVQKDLQDAGGRFVGRPDLYYPQARLVIEYDGVNHRERLAEDNRRQNLLISAGFQILRFTAADLRQRPETIVAQVRRALTPPKPASGTGRRVGAGSG